MTVVVVVTDVLVALVLVLGPPPPPPPAAPPPGPPPSTVVPPAPVSRCPGAPPTVHRGAPDLRRLHAAAVARAPITSHTTRGWRRRVRAAAVLPDLSVGWDLRLDQGYDLGQQSGAADELSRDALAANTFRVRADWSLDRLIFDPDELRVARAALDWLDWRARLLEQVTALHAEYVSLLLARRSAIAADPCSPDLAVIDAKLVEVAGHLYALTGLEV